MNKSTLFTAIIMLVIGLGIGYFLSDQGEGPANTLADNISVPKNNENPLFYRNAMNPSVTSPVPAKDAMGMDYTPVYAVETDQKAILGTVKIDPVVVQNIGVRTGIAKKESMSRTIRAVGRVDFDEQKMARLHPKVEGWIEDLNVDKTGETVKEGDVLVSIYSPKLVSTQQEYLLALNSLKSLENSPFEDVARGAKDMVASARERLKLLDVPEHQIVELEKSRKIKKQLHIHTPVDGTVTRIGSRQGQYVTPKTELYMVVDLSQVWVYADVYEYELPWIKVGDEVEMTLVSVPGKIFSGRLGYIYPYAEAKTRTTKVRIIFDNPEQLLRPDMFAEITIHSDVNEAAIVIPSQAVIRSGERSQVFVVTEPGRFEPRIVTLGIESNGKVAVLSGLIEGEEVVTSAQFMVDSESKLREATEKMMLQLQNKKSSNNKMPPMDMKNSVEMKVKEQ
ncbi:efflux RND transporter periplasmic adaptor subunit [Colwellia sp. Arc7-D]|uniref:efflux RND transporter periplasmic adaptor subunit n=1 Tax=Colwellia sp. Arc7-D TaxID=2161872 RepID=UPI000D347C61|nr:efflux RND transporter periplasmic adaptor subunit [Colwellia sp. Arc7-D]AWB58421.1 efflux transporter periplasmic adaptor subunit [Colwellia sp. Arc7-D]